MLRKLAMVVVVVFLGPIGTGVQLMVCLGVVMTALVAQVGRLLVGCGQEGGQPRGGSGG